MRAALTPLWDEYRVDLVVPGRNHQYGRTNPIRGARSTSRATDRYRGGPAGDSGTVVTSFVTIAGGRVPETVD